MDEWTGGGMSFWSGKVGQCPMRKTHFLISLLFIHTHLFCPSSLSVSSLQSLCLRFLNRAAGECCYMITQSKGAKVERFNPAQWLSCILGFGGPFERLKWTERELSHPSSGSNLQKSYWPVAWSQTLFNAHGLYSHNKQKIQNKSEKAKTLLDGHLKLSQEVTLAAPPGVLTRP